MPFLQEFFTESPERTTMSTSYAVTDQPVHLSFIIGDIGQTAESEIWIDGLKQQSINGSFRYDEAAENLVGHVMKVFTLVTDTSRATNYTEVGVHIIGGRKDFHSRLHKEVDTEGESVMYLTEISFYE